MTNHTYQAGSTVYIIVSADCMLKQDVVRGTVRAFYKDNGTSYAVVERDDNHQQETVPVNSLYQFEQDASSQIYQNHQAQLQAYLDDIQELSDLIRFAYEHNISMTSGPDWTARIAYQLKAEELTGIKLYAKTDTPE